MALSCSIKQPLAQPVVLSNTMLGALQMMERR